MNIVVPDPRELFDRLTREFEIPVLRPWTRFGGFESGHAALGINLEPVRYAPSRRTPVPADAGLFALAFEPEPLEQALRELARRSIPHSVPLRYAGTYPHSGNAAIFHEVGQAGQRRTLWTLTMLGGFFADEESARRLSRWPNRGDAPGARLLGGLAGRLAGGRLGDRIMAMSLSARPFAFLVEYDSFNVGEAQALARQELAERDGGPLGLLRTAEVVLGARDPEGEAERWQRLLNPHAATHPGCWQLPDGPAIRLTEDAEDRFRALVWEVASLARAADWLRARGWLGAERGETLQIDDAALQGVEVHLREHA